MAASSRARPARRCRSHAQVLSGPSSPAPDAPASARAPFAPAARAASPTSSAATGCTSPGSRAMTASRPGPAGDPRPQPRHARQLDRLKPPAPAPPGSLEIQRIETLGPKAGVVPGVKRLRLGLSGGERSTTRPRAAGLRSSPTYRRREMRHTTAYRLLSPPPSIGERAIVAALYGLLAVPAFLEHEPPPRSGQGRQRPVGVFEATGS